MQVIRVRRVTLNDERAEVWIVDAQGNQVGATISAGDVIELTEEREDGTARFDSDWHGDVRRFVSDWKPVDGD